MVQVHDDKLVCWGQIHWHLGELFVKVTSVPSVPLQVGFTGLKWREMFGMIKKFRGEWDGVEKERKHWHYSR